jgi:hypothetical protein
MFTPWYEIILDLPDVHTRVLGIVHSLVDDLPLKLHYIMSCSWQREWGDGKLPRNIRSRAEYRSPHLILNASTHYNNSCSNPTLLQREKPLFNRLFCCISVPRQVGIRHGKNKSYIYAVTNWTNMSRVRSPSFQGLQSSKWFYCMPEHN